MLARAFSHSLGDLEVASGRIRRAAEGHLDYSMQPSAGVTYAAVDWREPPFSGGAFLGLRSLERRVVEVPQARQPGA